MQKWKNNRRILLGVSGGISAYKTPDLVRLFVKAGCDVEIIMTESAESFITPLTLSTLIGRPVWRERDFLSAESGWKIPHISLAEWAELFVIAPCTANVLAYCASGSASTLLGATLLAYRGKVLFCPAMNVNMLSHLSTQENLTTLTRSGYTVMQPGVGPLACGYDGSGRLPDVKLIADWCWDLLYPHPDSLSGSRVLITAGPTHEYVDPVRFISNPSSGKMGYALAIDAMRRGADVTLVSGPTSLPHPHKVKIINVISALEMANASRTIFPEVDVAVMAAAVGDFRVKEIQPAKIKRKEPFALEMEPNPDIAATLGAAKRADQYLVGFAAETHDLERNAFKKLSKKKLDMIVANDVLQTGSGFSVDTNEVHLFTSSTREAPISGTKEQVAEAIWGKIIKNMLHCQSF